MDSWNIDALSRSIEKTLGDLEASVPPPSRSVPETPVEDRWTVDLSISGSQTGQDAQRILEYIAKSPATLRLGFSSDDSGTVAHERWLRGVIGTLIQRKAHALPAVTEWRIEEGSIFLAWTMRIPMWKLLLNTIGSTLTSLTIFDGVPTRDFGGVLHLLKSECGQLRSLHLQQNVDMSRIGIDRSAMANLGTCGPVQSITLYCQRHPNSVRFGGARASSSASKRRVDPVQTLERRIFDRNMYIFSSHFASLGTSRRNVVLHAGDDTHDISRDDTSVSKVSPKGLCRQCGC